ncbi:MAG: hypothetical protein LUI12_01635 [Clostridiales bacterium]|nr:hypothetical protein [Clostridiales bacterium]
MMNKICKNTPEDESCKYDPEYVNKLLIDSVVINEEIPAKLRETIKNLEECNRKGNWLDYDMYENILESDCKNLLINSEMSERLFNKLMRRYGRYV